MAKQSTSFRIQSKHLVFLEMLAKENGTDRSKELSKILDAALQKYLESSQAKSSKRAH